MNTKANSASSDSNSLLNISHSFDPLLAESEIRAAAQQALAQAIVRTVKLAFKNIFAVLSDATELQKQHDSKPYGAV